MPEKRNTLYNLEEIEEIANAVTSVAYAMITVDELYKETNPKLRSSIARNILENTIPMYQRLPLKVKHRLNRNRDLWALERKCKEIVQNKKSWRSI
jgi:hypothetical protein